RSAFELIRAGLQFGRVVSQTSGKEMVRNRAPDEIEPETRKLAQHAALVRNTLVHHDVEGGEAVGGNHQQFVAQLIDVPDFAARKEFDSRQMRFEKSCVSHGLHGCWFRASDILEQLKGMSTEKAHGKSAVQVRVAATNC